MAPWQAENNSDRVRALSLVSVSRETLARLDAFVALLKKWNPSKNLVAASTLPEVWTRHVADSLQLLPYLGGARMIVDLGSGGGFPGIPLAIAASDIPGFCVHSIESKQGKVAFQREAARITQAPVTVHAARIEEVVAHWEGPKVDLVVARALAPLDDLLRLAHPLLKTGARALLLKGQDVASELTQAAKSWRLDVELIPSLTDPRGAIARIDKAEIIASS